MLASEDTGNQATGLPICPECGSLISSADAFCGGCGTQHDASSKPPAFGHATAEPPGPMSNTTRYLCAAAYLDPHFAGTVLRELMGSRRAVAPSRGIDLIPVIRHCLAARRLRIIRDTVLTFLLVLGVFVAVGPLLTFLGSMFLLTFLPKAAGWRRTPESRKVIAWMICGQMVAALLYSVFAIVFDLYVDLIGTVSGSPTAGALNTPAQLNWIVDLGIVNFCLLVITILAYGRSRNLAFLPGYEWQRKSSTGMMIAAVIVSQLGVSVVMLLFRAVVSTLDVTGGAPPVPSLQLNTWTGAIGLLYLGLLVGTLTAYGWARNRTLIRWLNPDSPVLHPRSFRDSTERRLEQIRHAQAGNLTIYSGEDPFLGAGSTPFEWRKADDRVGSNERAWSITVELNKATTEAEQNTPAAMAGAGHLNGALDGACSRQRVAINPIELHNALRKRFLALSDTERPASQRVPELTVDDQIVAEGWLLGQSPLVDPVSGVPFSQANPEAIAALITNPQARLRHYQRASISDQRHGKPGVEQRLFDSPDQEVVASAFVHLAVEGDMFYLQFVPTSLSPAADWYRLIDELPRMSSPARANRALIDAACTAFGDVFGAPFHLAGMLWQIWNESRPSRPSGDIGARISVRQLAAQDRPRTYMQQLDVAKYTQILERLVLETVLDFLVAKGVDTTAYRARAQAIYNSGIIVAGDASHSTLTTSR
jgi:hypothetical protein